MLRYITVEKCKRRKVNETNDQNVVNKMNDKVCQPNYTSSSCTTSLGPCESGSGEFPSIRGNSKNDRKLIGAKSSVPCGKASRNRMFELKEVKGDLFSCPPSSCLAHCISADCRMGKGIAVIFKKKFGGVKELLSQGQSPGGVATLRRDGRYVYYLVTKEKYWHKPTYETLTASLEAMKKHCLKQGTIELAMPKIGCGLDGLNWPKVCAVIRDVFGDTDITITVYVL